MNSRAPKQRRTILVVFLILLALIVGLLAYGAYTAAVSTTQPSNPVVTNTPTSISTSTSPTVIEPEDSGVPTGTGYTVEEINSILVNLGVAESVDNTGYVRSLFGDGWIDTDNNGCDTRNDILLRDLIDVTIDTDGCRVLSGTLIDSYTGDTIEFIRGQSTSTAVQIDHLVPLSRAWALGASHWDEATREAFANDPMNLFAVDGPANNNKSDQGFSDWTPAIYSCISDEKDAGNSTKNAKTYCLGINVYDGAFYTAFDCEYAARYVLVSDKYDLAITTGDAKRITEALATCK